MKARTQQKSTVGKRTKQAGSKSGSSLAPSELLCMLKEDLSAAGVQMRALDRGLTSAISLQPLFNLTIPPEP